MYTSHHADAFVAIISYEHLNLRDSKARRLTHENVFHYIYSLPPNPQRADRSRTKVGSIKEYTKFLSEFFRKNK